MNRDERLIGSFARPDKPRPDRAAKLGDAVSEYVEHCVSPQQAKFAALAQLWGELLPDELHRHCRIVDVSAGRLKVQVDSPSYANELRWCSSELLEQLQEQCPRAKIKKIKIVLG